MAAVDDWLASFDYSVVYTSTSPFAMGHEVGSPTVVAGKCPIRLLVQRFDPEDVGPFHPLTRVSAIIAVHRIHDWLDDWDYPNVHIQIQLRNAKGKANITKVIPGARFNKDKRSDGWDNMVNFDGYKGACKGGWIFEQDSTMRFHVKVKGSSLLQSMQQPADVGDHYGRLWQEMKFADMHVSGGEDGALLPCHRAVLAATSPVFDRMLSAGMKEGVEQKVVFPHVSTMIAQTLLQYVYTGSFPVEAQFDTQVLLDLLPLADQYELVDLAGLCAKRLVAVMSPPRVCDVLAALRTHRGNPGVAEHFEAAKEEVHKDRALFDTVIESVRGGSSAAGDDGEGAEA